MPSDAPSPFSAKLPKLQLAWDSTSLGELMFCPRRYQYSILEGWRSSGVDVEFGGMFASASETFKKARLEGLSKDDAILRALDQVLKDSWLDGGDSGHCDCPDGCNGCEHPQGHPWGGAYEDLWHCTGTEKYRNAKGNAAKCPWSHKGKWFPGPAPEPCGECGSPTEVERRWVPVDPNKNRKTLVRLVVWYCDEQPEDADGLQPLAFPNGQPAVELSFKLPLPWKAKTGEPYILAGHLDSIMTNGQENFIADNKTTKKTLGPGYWGQYSPNVQVDVYDLAGSIMWPELGLRGVMIEAAQTLVDGANFGSHIAYRTEPMREEFFKDLEWWLKQAERFAEDDYWPMNRKNCGFCSFKGICSKEPSKREMYLKAEFQKKHWNPLEER